MSEPLRILLVEDSEIDEELVLRALRKGPRPVESERVQTAEAMRASLASKPWDAVVSDWSMPDFSALAALEVLKESGLDLPFIIVSGTVGEEIAVQAMRAGAHDYALKDKLARLVPAIERGLRERDERRARREAEKALAQSQEQLRQVQKMEAIGRLAGGVAHDFNNLLSVILTYSEMGMRSLGPDEPLRDDLDQIRQAGERAAGLTRQLLAFSRQQLLAPQIVDLNELIAGTGKMLGRLVREDIELVTRQGPDLGAIRADPGQLEQVLMNLVVNARDAMPSGGRITIETANVDVDAEFARSNFGLEPGPYVLLSMTDTGVGMDEATQARIFEPFFTTKEQGKGTGLGLATVFGIMQQSKGHITVESEPGKGTTFKAYFPRTDEAVTAAKASLDELHKLSGSETILLVEDEDQIRAMILGLLRSFGYRVLEARNGGEALMISEKHPARIHLLLTDVIMPYMNGAELAKRLLALRNDMKVLCMSGYADEAILKPGVIDAGLAFLQKPVTPDQLARKIREVLAVQA